MEVVALVWANGHKAGTHLKAVHLSRDAAIHVGNFVRIEVVTCRSRERPILGGADAGIHTLVLGPSPVILEFVVIESAVAVG